MNAPAEATEFSLRMNSVAPVFTLICVFVAGLVAYAFGTQILQRGPQGWTPVVGFMLCLVMLFSGPVIAADRTGWSYGVGGGLVCSLFALLWDYHKKESGRRDRYDESLAALCPDASQDATTTFQQALSIAVKRYGRVDASILSQLHMPTMQRVFINRLAGGKQLLRLNDYREECFYGLSFKDLSNFGRNGGVLLFTEPSESDRCRKWFVQCAVLLQRYPTAKDGDLVDIVRYVWQEDVMIHKNCYEFTLDAVKRLKGEYKEMLCQALHQKHPNNLWLNAHLPMHGDLSENESNSNSNSDPLATQSHRQRLLNPGH